MGQTTETDANAQNNSVTRHNETGNRRGKSSGLVRYELIDKYGAVHSVYDSAAHAAEVAKYAWPDQSQDEDRTGKGWDIQVAGAK